MYFSGRIHSNTYTTINMKGMIPMSVLQITRTINMKGDDDSAVDMH